MPLYRCSKCDVIENTAPGNFWQQQLEAHRKGSEFKPLCSQCHTGKWHGLFTRRAVTAEWLQDRQGFLWRKHEAETVPHLGPFLPVQVL